MIRFIETKRLSLNVIDESYVNDNYTSWLNNDEVCMYNSHRRYPYNKSENNEYIKNISSSRDVIVFAIVEKNTERHIGNISLQQINYIDRSAEIAFIIGEVDCWGKGYAYEAGEAVICHAFEQLNLHRVFCGTSEENIGMQKVAEKLKFIKEGVRREAIYKSGRYHNIIEYGLLRTDIDWYD